MLFRKREQGFQVLLRLKVVDQLCEFKRFGKRHVIDLQGNGFDFEVGISRQKAFVFCFDLFLPINQLFDKFILLQRGGQVT